MHDIFDDDPPLPLIAGSVTGPVVTIEQASEAVETAVSGPPRAFTDLQWAFMQAFIENGGKAGDAAITAGASHDTYGIRILAMPKVQEELVRRIKLQSGTALAIALSAIFKVIETSSDDKAIVSAAFGLMDRYGMSAPKGGTSIHIGDNNIDARQASAVLVQVAERAAKRLAR